MKPLKEFHRCSKSADRHQYECKACSRERYRRHQKRSHDAGIMTYSQRTRQRLRFEIITHYGGKCDCCGESAIEFLAVDHVNGGGNRQKKEIGCSGLYCWLKRNGFPKGFRVLCHNCNQSLAAYGYCPHHNPEKRLVCPPKAVYQYPKFCKNGHRMIPANCKVGKDGYRRCLKCLRSRGRRRVFDLSTE